MSDQVYRSDSKEIATAINDGGGQTDAAGFSDCEIHLLWDPTRFVKRGHPNLPP